MQKGFLDPHMFETNDLNCTVYFLCNICEDNSIQELRIHVIYFVNHALHSPQFDASNYMYNNLTSLTAFCWSTKTFCVNAMWTTTNKSTPHTKWFKGEVELSYYCLTKQHWEFSILAARQGENLTLTNGRQRNAWERQFDMSYISPVFLENKVSNAWSVMLEVLLIFL